MTQPSCPESTESPAAMSGSMTPRAEAFNTLRKRATQMIGSMAAPRPALLTMSTIAPPARIGDISVNRRGARLAPLSGWVKRSRASARS